MKYIAKDALVAEITHKIKVLEVFVKNFDGISDKVEKAKNKIEALGDALLFIDTLEVKEVDLEANIEDYINSHFTEGCDGGMISDWYKVLGGVFYNDLKEIAEHFFELGMVASNKAQKGKQ